MNISPFPDFDSDEEPDLTAEIKRLRHMPDLKFERVVTKAQKEAEREEKVTRKHPRPAKERNARQGLDGILLNEDDVALAFTKALQDQLRYCHGSQSWFLWTGSVWRREETKLAFLWARKTCREAAANLGSDDKTRAAVARAAFAAAVERYARADREFAVTAATWDQDPWLLGTPGGTVNLKTGELRPAQKSEHITKQTAVTPSPKGTPHPIWSEFLNQATGGDKATQEFLQRFDGYCLTGDVIEELMAFLYGEGGAGKGTFIGTVSTILGDYAVSVPIEVFVSGSRLNLEYYRAKMAGARLVTASETDRGTAWGESQIKEMTGNEAPLSARHPYGKPFNFRPQFKICLVGNHAPQLKAKSKAMERRLRIIPFNHLSQNADKTLKERLRAEFPAILRWMIDGCLMWQREGLGTCPAVGAATSAYFEQQDAFGRWLSERCLRASSMAPVSEKPSRLLIDYLAWARDSGESAVTSTEFREMIERTPGLRYATNKGTQWVRGIGLKPADGSWDRLADPGL